MVAAGSLDRRISIETQESTIDDFGATRSTWCELIKLSARREDVTDAERFAAGEKGAAVQTRWIIRSTAKTRTITPKDRLIDENAINHEILGVKQTRHGRRRFLEISTAARNDG